MDTLVLVQTARFGATYPVLLDQEQLHLLLPHYMHCKEGVGRICVQVGLDHLFLWSPGWSERTGEVGDTRMKEAWLHLRALCL